MQQCTRHIYLVRIDSSRGISFWPGDDDEAAAARNERRKY